MVRLALAVGGILSLAAAIDSSAAWPPDAPDLAVTVLHSSPSCLEAESCTYFIRLSNEGTASFNGPVKLLHHSTVPAVPDGETKCERLNFNAFRCPLDVSLAPRAAMDAIVTMRMLPTPLPQSELCVSIDWKDGDPVAGDDRSCTTIKVEPQPPAPACSDGQWQVAGSCREIATFCTGGRNWDAATQSCACPTSSPLYDRNLQNCVTSVAAVSCSGGREASNGGCFCPEDKPVWNAATSRCEAEKVEIAAAQPEAIVKPVKKSKPKAAAAAPKKPAAANGVKRKAKVAHTRKSGKKPIRLAAKPLPKCPPLWRLTKRGYCWPGWWISPDDLERLAGGQP